MIVFHYNSVQNDDTGKIQSFTCGRLRSFGTFCNSFWL